VLPGGAAAGIGAALLTDLPTVKRPSCFISACAAESLKVREGGAVAFFLDPLAAGEGFGPGGFIKLHEFPINLLQLSRWWRRGELEVAVLAVGKA
jgi:hypothetical protein